MGNRVSAGAVRGEIRKGLVVAGGCLGLCGSECGAEPGCCVGDVGQGRTGVRCGVCGEGLGGCNRSEGLGLRCGGAPGVAM